MSGIYLLALIAIWLFAGWIIYRLWRRWKPAALSRKVPHIILGILLFSVWFGGAFWEIVGKKMYYDAKVRELCAQDGGFKVYETVKLTAELLDKFGRINIPDKSKAKPTDEYYYQTVRNYLHKGSLVMSRTQHKIIRRIDGKVLGELTRYGRGGGDLPGPWHGSSFMCPDPTESSNFETLIFVNGGEK